MVGSSFLFPWLQNAQTLSLLNTMPATCVVGKAGTVQAFHHLPSLKSPALLPPAEKPTSGVNAPLPLVPPSSGGCWAADECFASRDGTVFPLCCSCRYLAASQSCASAAVNSSEFSQAASPWSGNYPLSKTNLVCLEVDRTDIVLALYKQRL